MRSRGARGRPSHRRAGITVLLAAAVCSIGVLPAGAAPSSAPDRAAEVQAMLDTVLGPGGSVVQIAATVRTGASSIDTIRYGSATPVAATSSRWATANGTASTGSRLDAVGSTRSSVVIPAGALVRQSVSVAVDSRALGSTPVARIRALVAGAAAVVPGRGDRLSIVVARFARTPAVVVPTPPWTAALLPMAVPAIEGGGVLIGLLVLLRAFGVGRRRRSAILRRS